METVSLGKIEEVIQQSPLCVVSFGKSNCIPCKTVTNIMKSMEDEYVRVLFYKCLLDNITPQDQDVLDRLEVKTVPTTNVYNGGQKIARLRGVFPPNALSNVLP